MSEWLIRRIGDLVKQRKDVVVLQSGVKYRTMGVRWYGRGAYDRGAGTTETIRATRLWRVHAGDFVFNRIDTQNGAFDVVPPELDGALITNEFPTYVGLPGVVDERFLLAYFQQQSVQDAIGFRRAGSEGRARWKEADFESWTLALPPIDEQRRIVAVLAAVDANITALEAEVDRLDRLVTTAVQDGVDGAPIAPLATTLLGIEAGRSPQALTEPPTDSQRGVLKVSAVRSRRFLAKESKALADGTQMPVRAEVRPGDLLITRANTPVLVGLVCRVPADVRPGLYLSDKTLRMIPDLGVADPDYLEAVMGLPSIRAWLGGNATGTSASMLNLSQNKIQATPIPLLALNEQRKLAKRIAEMTTVSKSVAAELGVLRTVRADLLTALLSQEISVDAAVDKFVKVA